MKYKKVAVGGSFDVLHKGHVALLDKAFNAGEFVLIGLTSNEMLTKDVAPFEKRKKALVELLRNKAQYDIVLLNDPLGPAASDGTIEAIVVSVETLPGALQINEIRKKNGLKALEIISIPLVLADDGKQISSTRVKRGEIDKDGRILTRVE
jgi:pantetheine-phosphate adenylyltransferase